jgi:hypothetical protein
MPLSQLPTGASTGQAIEVAMNLSLKQKKLRDEKEMLRKLVQHSVSVKKELKEEVKKEKERVKAEKEEEKKAKQAKRAYA